MPAIRYPDRHSSLNDEGMGLGRMEPVPPWFWKPVPGYSSDDEDDVRSPEGLQSVGFSKVCDLDLRETETRLSEVLNIMGPRNQDRPLINFSPAPTVAKGALLPAAAVSSSRRGASTAPSFHLTSDARVLKETFLGHGMVPTVEKTFSLHWSGPSIKDTVYQNLEEWQRILHFPGSTELTRKDRLWRHFAEMADLYGSEAFDFVPETFILPEQIDKFLECYERTNHAWIVKPHASSQGKGIFMLRDLGEIPEKEIMVVSRYVKNPLLIQGLKFDLRMYVLVTSFDPLKAFIYREGLTRFASKAYSTKPDHMQDAFRHLTNYSINKNSNKFVENSDVNADNVGHKWSLSALNKHLHCVGVNVNLMWVRIMDLIVKTLLSVEPAISVKTKQIMPNRENCFELYGFDVLVDDQLKPWLLEVNLSPSMQADSPLDWQIKSALVADALNIVGVCQSERPERQVRQSLYVQSNRSIPAAGSRSSADLGATNDDPMYEHPLVLNALSDWQLKMLVKAAGERTRCRNFVPLYPTRNAVRRYALITEARAAAMRPSIPRSLTSTTSSALMAPGLNTRRLSASQILALFLYGPRPVRSVAFIRSRSMPMLPASSPAVRTPAHSSSPSPSSKPANPDALEVTFAPLTTERPGSVQEAASSEAALLSAAALEVEQLPAAVRDPTVSLEAREVALLNARKSLRLLGRPAMAPQSRDGSRKTHFSAQVDVISSLNTDVEDVDLIEERSGKDPTFSTGSCLLLMEYLQRLETACDNLGLQARTMLAQSSAYDRFSNFQRRLPTAASQMVDLSDASRHATDDGETGCLIGDLAFACRETLQVLEDKLSRQVLNDTDVESDQASDDTRASSLQLRLPRQVLRDKSCKKLLDAFSDLSAADLEDLLRGPLCAGGSGVAAALRPMFDAFSLRRKPLEDLNSPTHFESSRLRRATVSAGNLPRPQSHQSAKDGRKSLAADCTGGGPLSELLQVAISASRRPARARRRPIPAQEDEQSPKQGSTAYISFPPPAAYLQPPPPSIAGERAGAINVLLARFAPSKIRRRQTAAINQSRSVPALPELPVVERLPSKTTQRPSSSSSHNDDLQHAKETKANLHSRDTFQVHQSTPFRDIEF